MDAETQARFLYDLLQNLPEWDFLLIAPYILTCSFILRNWIKYVKLRMLKNLDEKVVFFSFQHCYF